MLFQISLVAALVTPADALSLRVGDLLEMIASLRVFKLPNFKAMDELFWILVAHQS